jgi:hypothetical protein
VIAGADSGHVARRLAIAQRDGDIERGLTEHAFDQRELGRRQARREHREAGSGRIVGGEGRERGGFASLLRPIFDERQLESATAQHTSHVAQHAKIEASPPG